MTGRERGEIRETEKGVEWKPEEEEGEVKRK